MLLIVSGSQLAFGHNFSSNESELFLALVEIIRGEAQLVQRDLASNNMSLANEHADRTVSFVTEDVNNEIAERNQRLADELHTAALKTSTKLASCNDTSADVKAIVSDIDGILDEIITARIDPDQLNNSTIQALVVVELLDTALASYYGDAYDVGFDMANMSMMMGGNNDDTNSMSSMDMGSDNMSISNTSTSNRSDLVNITSHQTAQI
jgi:hypothetical protein